MDAGARLASEPPSITFCTLMADREYPTGKRARMPKRNGARPAIRAILMRSHRYIDSPGPVILQRDGRRIELHELQAWPQVFYAHS
jgi:hypothetical protein